MARLIGLYSLHKFANFLQLLFAGYLNSQHVHARASLGEFLDWD